MPADSTRNSRSGNADDVEILIISLLIFLALLPVLIPFFRSSKGSPPGSEQTELQELLAEKQTVYAAIKELEFDHQAGKLSLEDYEQARHSYELRAIALLQEIDRLGGQRGSQDVGSREKRLR
jgi:flagellar basal body-associated protein FliL